MRSATRANTGDAGLLGDLIGGFETEPVEVRQHITGDAFGGRREFGKAGFDGLSESGRHRKSRRSG
jgi:hypothetical protein